MRPVRSRPRSHYAGLCVHLDYRGDAVRVGVRGLVPAAHADADGAVRVFGCEQDCTPALLREVLGPDLDAGRRVTVRKDIFSAPSATGPVILWAVVWTAA